MFRFLAWVSMFRFLAWVFDWELVWVLANDNTLLLLKTTINPFGKRIVYWCDVMVHLNDDGTCEGPYYKKWNWARKKGEKLF